MVFAVIRKRSRKKLHRSRFLFVGTGCTCQTRAFLVRLVGSLAFERIGAAGQIAIVPSLVIFSSAPKTILHGQLTAISLDM